MNETKGLHRERYFNVELMFGFIRRTIRKTIDKLKFIAHKISITSDNLCLKASTFTPETWNRFSRSRVRDRIIGLISAINTFIILGIGGGLACMILPSPIAEEPLIVFILRLLSISTILLMTGFVELSGYVDNLSLFQTTLFDGLCSSKMLSKHFKTSVIEEITFEFNKVMRYDNKYPELKTLKESMDNKPDEAIFQFLKQQNDPNQFARILTELNVLFGGGTMSGIQERNVELFGDMDVMVLRRNKIPIANPEIKINAEIIGQLKLQLPLWQANFEFLREKEKRVKRTEGLLQEILSSTNLAGDVAGLVVSFTDSFHHPILKVTKEDHISRRILRSQILSWRDEEITEVARKMRKNT